MRFLAGTDLRDFLMPHSVTYRIDVEFEER